jgi:hypothetical protein
MGMLCDMTPIIRTPTEDANEASAIMGMPCDMAPIIRTPTEYSKLSQG